MLRLFQSSFLHLYSILFFILTSESTNWRISQKFSPEKRNGDDFNDSNAKVDHDVEFEDLEYVELSEVFQNEETCIDEDVDSANMLENDDEEAINLILQYREFIKSLDLQEKFVVWMYVTKSQQKFFQDRLRKQSKNTSSLKTPKEFETLIVNEILKKEALDDSDQYVDDLKKEALDDLGEDDNDVSENNKDINYIFEYHKPANNRSTLTTSNECLLCYNMIALLVYINNQKNL